MIAKKRQGLIKKIFYSQKFLALLGLVVIVLISFPLAKNISRRYEVNQEIKELEREIAQLEEKNIDLEGFISYLESDQFVEEQARLNLGLKKEGEGVAVVKTDSSQQGDQAATATSTIFKIPGLEKADKKKPESNSDRWWNYFFN